MNSPKLSLLILGIAALLFARTTLLAFDDPEGPNLLIVVVLTGLAYFLSLAIYLYNPVAKRAVSDLSLTSATGLKNSLLIVLVQIVILAIFYVCLV